MLKSVTHLGQHASHYTVRGISLYLSLEIVLEVVE